MEGDKRDLRVIAKEVKDRGMLCNCDLDNWEPERTTGHSHVCRIHKRAMAMKRRPQDIQDVRDGMFDRDGNPIT